MNAKYPVVFGLILLILTACSLGRLKRNGNYAELSPSEFLKYVEDSSVNIIDVRTLGEFTKSHIHGAVNASYFSGHFSELVDSLQLDESKTTLIYCETQHRSLFAAKKLYKAGFRDIIDLDKGMLYWRKNGFPCADSI